MAQLLKYHVIFTFGPFPFYFDMSKFNLMWLNKE